MHCKTVYFFLVVFCHIPLEAWSWGFFAHRQINRYAITSLPPAMFAFYKAHLAFLTEKSVNPDKRRYVFQDEAAKHFIDLEIYHASLLNAEKLLFKEVLAKYGQEIVEAHGKLPWAILNVQKQLTEAFRDKDIAKILKYSADLGHYVADAHVPLHTTENYNGQITGQEGIHALWETRLPVLFFQTYNLFVGQAVYIKDISSHVWKILLSSYALLGKVLDVEKEISAQYPAISKYSFEQEGSLLKKQYAIGFATAYHQALQGQVEARLKQSIIEVGSFWFTAWINGGAPTLDDFNTNPTTQDEEEVLLQQGKKLKGIRVCGDS